MTISASVERSVALLLGVAGLGCASVPHMGDRVATADESAIIIWDKTAKTQHFIRRATFRTVAKDFGFLVPTPSVPQLAEASDDAFQHLEQLTASRVAVVAKGKSALAREPRPKAAVTVVTRAKVAGYDAVVLEASDANALNAWLKKHEYASSPELVEWFEPYLQRKWFITAFKVADRLAIESKSNVSDDPELSVMFNAAQSLERDGNAPAAIRIYRRIARRGVVEAAERLAIIYDRGVRGVERDLEEARQWHEYAGRLRGSKARTPSDEGSGRVTTKRPAPETTQIAAAAAERLLYLPAVRISFKAERPFYPYREPTVRVGAGDQGHRLLRIYVLATTRMSGKPGDSGKLKTWQHRTVWSDRISATDRSALLRYLTLPETVAASSNWLTEFTDDSSPRPAFDDLFFEESAASSVSRKRAKRE